MDKKDIIYNLDNLKKEYLKIDTLQKIYDKNTEKKLQEYLNKNNLPFDYIPQGQEWQDNIGSIKFPQWYKDIDKRKKEVFNIVIKNLEKITKIKLDNFYQEYKIFNEWLKMPFCK